MIKSLQLKCIDKRILFVTACRITPDPSVQEPCGSHCSSRTIDGSLLAPYNTKKYEKHLIIMLKIGPYTIDVKPRDPKG